MKLKLAFWIFFLCYIGFSQTGKLEKVKENLQRENTESHTVSLQEDSNDSTQNYKSFGDLWTQFFLNLTYGVAIETVFEQQSKMHSASLSKYPYILNGVGNYSYHDSVSVNNRFSITNKFLFESKRLYGNALEIQFRFAKRMGVGFQYNELIEKKLNSLDHLSLFYLTL